MFQRPILDYALLAVAKAHCRRVLRRMVDQAARHATAIQERVLLEKIRRNADSDYGRAHHFEHIRSYRDFKERVPIQTYEDMMPTIARLRRGEHHALFGGGQRVRMFALTSGTEGEPKYIPVTDAFLRELRAGWNAFGIKALLDHPDNFLRPIVQVTSRMDETTTEAGIPCGAVTGLMAKSQKRLVRKYYLTPLSVAYVEDTLARYYTIMRLAVAVERIGFMVTANPATQLQLARTADEHGEQLVRDIHDGTLWGELNLPDWVRAHLADRLQPRPARARQLHHLLETHGRLLPKHYWKLGFLCNWMGGTLRLFLKDFPAYFGDTPVRDIGLIASEGRMSIPVEDGTPAGILEVSSNFYEFIPAAQMADPKPQCCRSHEVQVGHDYAIVLTNSAGLYRYSIGDVVRVVGFEAQAPIIEFLNKGAHVCSLTGEKLTEHQVITAVNAVLVERQVAVHCYVLAPQWADVPYYRLYLEPIGPDCLIDTQRLSRAVDRRLGEVNIEYRSKQQSLRLGPVQIKALPPGFLEARTQRLKHRYRQGNEQYKHKFLLTDLDEDKDFPEAQPGVVAGLGSSD